MLGSAICRVAREKLTEACRGKGTFPLFYFPLAALVVCLLWCALSVLHVYIMYSRDEKLFTKYMRCYI
jgi:cytochrome b